MAFVLDASSATAWFLEDEESSFSRSLFARAEAGEDIYVPAHWLVEILSALLKAERRDRTDASGLDEAVQLLYSLRLQIQPALSAAELKPVLLLCRRHRLSAYDATYLFLAIETGLPLATKDAALLRASEDEQVATLRWSFP